MSDADCANPDEVCVGGACVVKCASGLTNCSGTCLDTSFDVNNCGACGNVCGVGELCGGGSCTCPDYEGDGYMDATCVGLDCNESDANINPGAPDICDGVDNNRNGVVDEGCSALGACYDWGFIAGTCVVDVPLGYCLDSNGTFSADNRCPEGYTKVDCMGEPGGAALVDECGVCNGDGTSCL